MLPCFGYYRRRRVLPFAAIYALVFINGQTLAPLVIPASAVGITSQPDGMTGASDSCQLPLRLQYERNEGTSIPEPSISACPPPIVKNLRRVGGDQKPSTSSGRHAWRVTSSAGPCLDFRTLALAANAADLKRLCRLLL